MKLKQKKVQKVKLIFAIFSNMVIEGRERGGEREGGGERGERES